jgi:ribosomal protein S13
MVFLYGIQIKDNLPVYIGLSRLYGIGIPSALLICQKLLIPYQLRFSQLSPSIISALNQHLSSLTLESNLRAINAKRRS